MVPFPRSSRQPFVYGLLGAVLAATACGRHATHGPHVIAVKDFRFEPMVDTVSAGDAVSWSNQDIVPHTVTSAGGRFDSGTIAGGKAWVLVIQETGRWTYSCTFHPTMKGVLVIR